MNNGRKKRRVLIHGLYYCGRMLAEHLNGGDWEFRYYRDGGLNNLAAMARELAACDLVYQIGGRRTAGKFLYAAKLLSKKKIVMHWTGSDTLEEQERGPEARNARWVMQDIHHWAVSQWIVKEVALLGVSSELVPIPSFYVPEQPAPLPSEFSVLVYVPGVRCGDLYGLDHILQVAKSLPEIPFNLVGFVQGRIPDPPANLKIHGRMPNLRDFYRSSSVVWRPSRHDGLSCMVMEGLGYGRHVMWTYPFPGCLQVSSAEEARGEIRRLYELQKLRKLQLNADGPRYLAEAGYLPGHLKQVILQRLQVIAEG
jgi:glycosyltransferase involved in cell wall biosynthesis